MDWREAKAKTLAEWLRILEILEETDPVQVVTDINAVCALCEKAREAAASASERCSHCIAFGDTKICEDYRFRLSELVIDQELGAARELMEQVIERVRQAELPGEDGSSAEERRATSR